MGAKPVTGIAAGLSFAQQQQAATGSSEAAASGESDTAETTGLLTADVDSEMVQHLRRLSKRDATTKLKALQACLGLCPYHVASLSLRQYRVCLPWLHACCVSCHVMRLLPALRLELWLMHRHAPAGASTQSHACPDSLHIQGLIMHWPASCLATWMPAPPAALHAAGPAHPRADQRPSHACGCNACVDLHIQPPCHGQQPVRPCSSWKLI